MHYYIYDLTNTSNYVFQLQCSTTSGRKENILSTVRTDDEHADKREKWKIIRKIYSMNVSRKGKTQILRRIECQSYTACVRSRSRTKCNGNSSAKIEFKLCVCIYCIVPALCVCNIFISFVVIVALLRSIKATNCSLEYILF